MELLKSVQCSFVHSPVICSPFVSPLADSFVFLLF
jgi:hypothetical protein